MDTDVRWLVERSDLYGSLSYRWRVTVNGDEADSGRDSSRAYCEGFAARRAEQIRALPAEEVQAMVRSVRERRISIYGR